MIKRRNQWELHILKEYHHLNDKLNDLQKKSPLNYISDYINFIKEAIELFNGINILRKYYLMEQIKFLEIYKKN